MNRGQLALVARLHHAEHRSRPDASQLEAAQEAIALAHDSVVQLELSLHAERRALQDAEAKASMEQKRRRAIQGQLKELEHALVHAEYRAYRHAQRHAEITAELQKERRLRQETEKQLEAERRAREDTIQALCRTLESRGFWKKLLGGR